MILFKKYSRDRRKFVRIKVHHLLKYRVIKKAGEEQSFSFVRNISAGGLLFYAKEYIPIGSILELEIVFPDTSESVKILSKVVRVNFLSKIGGFNTAVEFMDISRELQDFINNKILKVYENIQKKGGGNMLFFSTIFLLLAIISAIVGLVTKLFGINIFIAPINWVHIVNMILLFSISFTLLYIAKKK